MNYLYYKKNKLFIVICALVLVLTLTVALISSFWPSFEEQFFEFGLLGKDKKADGYYPNGNSTLNVGSQVNWYIYIHNHLENNQNVILKIKLLNSTMDLPNDKEHTPSPFIPILEFPLSLSVEDKLFVPFNWTSIEAIFQKNSTILKSMMINDQMVEINVPASNSFYRIVFELWVQDQVSEEYKFGWESGEGFSSASIYIGFELSSSVD